MKREHTNRPRRYRLLRTVSSSGITKDGLWSLGSTLLDRGGALFLTVVIARLLGAEALGTFSLILATCLVVVNPLAYGLSLAGTRRVAETVKHRLDQAVSAAILILSSGLLLMALCSVPFLLFPDILAERILHNPDLGGLLRLGSILLIGEFFRKVGIGLFFGFRAYKEQFLSTCILFCGLAFAALAAHMVGVSGVLIVNGLADLAAFAMGIFLVWRRFLSPRRNEFVLRLNFGESRVFIAYVLPALFSSLLPALVIWYVQVLLVKYGSSGQLGLFAASNQIRMAIVFLPAILSSVLIPRLVRLEEGTEEDNRFFTKYVLLSFGLSLILVLALGSVLTLLAPFLALVYGPEFTTHTSLFVVMIWVGCLNGVNQSLGAVIMSRGSMWVGFLSNAIWAMLVAAMAIAWIPSQLAMGIAQAMLYAYAVVTILQVTYVVLISPQIVVSLRRLLKGLGGATC